MIAKLLGLLGLLILAILAWVLGVRNILAHRHRAGVGRILSGLGLLVWAQSRSDVRRTRNHIHQILRFR
jgi:hypothetical protein